MRGFSILYIEATLNISQVLGEIILALSLIYSGTELEDPTKFLSVYLDEYIKDNS